jgi:hypothetical protein
MDAVNPIENEVPIDISLLSNMAEEDNFEFYVSHFHVQLWAFFIG